MSKTETYLDRLEKRVAELRTWQKSEHECELTMLEVATIDVLEALMEIYKLLQRK